MKENSKKHWQTILIILITMLFTSFLFFLSLPKRGNPIKLNTVSVSENLIIDISGAVKNPGVYTLPSGSRVYDAIESAGGLEEDAYTGHLNQASLIIDEQKIEIPLLINNEADSISISQVGENNSTTVNLININNAAVEELIELPNIGETRANAIITYRNENGPFTSIDDIINISGIGEVTFDLIKNLITIFN